MYARVALLFSNPSNATSRHFSSISTAKTAIETSNHSDSTHSSDSNNTRDEESDNSQLEANQALIKSTSTPSKSRRIGKR